ncbi:MAG: class I SAM-dependent methyltransferase [Planctomycetota bacterium]
MEELHLHYQESDSLFIEEALDAVRSRGIAGDILFSAASQAEIGQGTFPKETIAAAAYGEIRSGENESGRAPMEIVRELDEPVFLAFAADGMKRAADNRYSFINLGNGEEALLAVMPVKKHSAIEGFFSEREGLFYRSLVRNIQGGRIVEVGSWKGLSASFIGRTANANNTVLHCVDWWEGSPEWKDREKIIAEKDIESTFRNNMADREINVEVVKEKSPDAAKRFDDESLDLVFIDASHEYDNVRADLKAWFRKLKPGAILSGHNYEERHDGVIRAVGSFADRHGLNIGRGTGSIWHTYKF